MTCAAATNSARSSRNSIARKMRWRTSASTEWKASRSMTVPAAPPTAPIAAKKKKNSLIGGAQGRALERFGEQHLLGEDQVGPVVVRHLVVVAHGDRVERTGDLAVAAEDAARQIDLVDRGVALAGAHAVVRRVLGRDHADAVGRARGRAQRAADALLEARVLEAVELVPPAEARV